MAESHSGVQTWHPGMAFRLRTERRDEPVPAGEPAEDGRADN